MQFAAWMEKQSAAGDCSTLIKTDQFSSSVQKLLFTLHITVAASLCIQHMLVVDILIHFMKDRI